MRTHNIPFLNVKKKIILKLSQICNYGICFKGPKNEFETTLVNEHSVFQPLKFHCISLSFIPSVLSNISNQWRRESELGPSKPC